MVAVKIYCFYVLLQIFTFQSVISAQTTSTINDTNKLPSMNVDWIVPILKTSIKTNITLYAGYGVLIHPRVVIGILQNDITGYKYSIGTYNWTMNTAHINSNHYKIIYRIKNLINAGVIHYKYLLPTGKWTHHLRFNYIKNVNIIVLENSIKINPVHTLSPKQFNETIKNNQCARITLTKTSNSIFNLQSALQTNFMDKSELNNRINNSVFNKATDEHQILNYFFNQGYEFLATKDQQFDETDIKNLLGSLLLCPSEDSKKFVLAGVLIDAIDGFPLYNFVNQDRKIQDQLNILEGRSPNFDDTLMNSTLVSYINEFIRLHPDHFI